MTTLREYFVGGYKDSAKAMRDQRQEAKNKAMSKLNKKSKENINNLQAALNSVFYSESSIERDNFNELASQAYQAVFNRVYKNFNTDENLTYFSGDNLDSELAQALNRIRNREMKHTQQISYSTIDKDIKDCKTILNAIATNPQQFNPKRVEELRNKIINCLNFLLDLIDNYFEEDIDFNSLEGSKEFMRLINNKGKGQNVDYVNIVKKIDRTLSDIKFSYSTKSIGDWFESALSLFSIMARKGVELNIQELTEELKKGVKGSTYAKGDQLLNLATIVENNFFDSVKSNSAIGKQVLRYEEGTKTVELEVNMGNSRQGKIDVYFEFGGENIPYRISAKNWGDLYSKDFGSTSLLNAMGRVINNSSAMEHFLYTLGASKANRYQLREAQLLARTAIILDVLMGYSQKENWADTIVINNRAKSEILVYDMRALLEILLEDLDKMQSVTSKFDFSKLSHTGLEIYKDALVRYKSSGQDQSSYFKIELLRAMQKIDATVLYKANIFNQIK